MSLTQEQIFEAVRRYEAGEGCLGIARSFGYATGKPVKTALEALDLFVPDRKFQGRHSPADKADMVARYIVGESLRAIATRYECDPGTVRIILRTRGVRTRKPGTPPHADDPSQDADIREMREQRMSIREIAAVTGLSKHRVLQRARAMGLADKKMPRGPKNSLWAGGRVYRHYTGYYYVAVDLDDPMRVMAQLNGQVPEHRLIMARSLGRPLTRFESVHHIDGDRANNRLENLQLRKGNHGNGVVMACLDCGSHNVGPVPIAD